MKIFENIKALFDALMLLTFGVPAMILSYIWQVIRARRYGSGIRLSGFMAEKPATSAGFFSFAGGHAGSHTTRNHAYLWVINNTMPTTMPTLQFVGYQFYPLILFQRMLPARMI